MPRAAGRMRRSSALPAVAPALLLLLLLLTAGGAPAARAADADADADDAKPAAAEPAPAPLPAADDPWQAPVLGFRDLSEAPGPSSAESGGLGIVPLKVPAGGRNDVHALVLTDCAKYQDWQTIAAAFSWRESGQPGNVTRVVNCSPQETKSYGKTMMEVMPTFWARQYAYNARIKDWYAAYNKPGAVVDFLSGAPAREAWVVALDSDMLLHRPFLPEMFNLTTGWAVGAAGYTYLKGVVNGLAMRHVAGIAPRNDTNAGPKGRRGDQVGGPYFMSTDDMRRVAPLWLSTTEEMRQDLEAWRDSGDTSFKPGKPVWISEMYGYAFGAARAGVWHKGQENFMHYPSYTPSDVPHVIHYGLQYSLDGWEFDKHYYYDFDPFKCPPWGAWPGYESPRLRGLAAEALAASRAAPPPKPAVDHPKEGIFPPPPHPARAANDTKPYLDRYRDLLSIFTVAQINAALCEFHAATCPYSSQLEAVCGDAWELYLDTRDAVGEIEHSWGCADHNRECKGWAEQGECQKSKAYMADHCAPACGLCERDPRKGEYVPRARAPLRFAAPGAAAAARAGGEKQQEGEEAPPPKEEEGAEGQAAEGDQGGEHADGGAQDWAEEDGPAATAPAVKPAAEQQQQQQARIEVLGGGGGAAKAAAAAQQAAAATAALTDAQLKGRYPAAPAGSAFPDLVRRCSSSFDPPLDDAALGVCVRAATLRLEYHRAAGGAGGGAGGGGGGGGAGGGGGGGGGGAAAGGGDHNSNPAYQSLRAGQVLRFGGALEAELIASGRRAEEALEGALRERGVARPGRALLFAALLLLALAALGALMLARRRLVSRRGGARLPMGGGNYVQLIKPTGGHRSD